MTGPVVALDLGTNTFLMLVAKSAREGQLEIVDDVCRTPRLGAGLALTGEISADALRRALDVLREFDTRLRAAGLHGARLRVVGTAALRRARNAAEFIAKAKTDTGFEIEVVSEADEARLGWLAVTSEYASEQLAVVDVGGGSTELTADEGRVRHSIPIGAVVLTETFQGERIDAAYEPDAWRALLAEVERACATWPDVDARRWIALGGTGANVACLELGLPRFQPTLTEGVAVMAQAVAAWAERLAALDVAARKALPIEAERAEILPAGLACLAGALRRFRATSARISGRGLRFGVARELLASD